MTLPPPSRRLSLAVAIAAALTGGPAFAANDAMQQLLKVLHAKGTIDDETYQALMVATKADDEVNAAQGGEVGKKVEQSLAQSGTPSLSPAKFEVKDKTGDYSWRIIGRAMYDAAIMDPDGQFAGNDAGQFRRLRLGVQGAIATNWKFKAEYDFREADTGIAGLKDAYIDYVGPLPLLTEAGLGTSLKIGQSHEPFSFDLINSSKDSLFTERALPVDLFAKTSGERNPGLKLTTWGKDWTAAAGVFTARQEEKTSDVACEVPAGGFNPGDKFTCTGGTEETPAREFGDGYAATTRVTYAPWHDGGHVLHVGTGFSYRELVKAKDFRLRERFEVNETSTRLVDTGTFKADNFLRWNAELAAVEGPFTFQGEYFLMRASRPLTTQDPVFTGYYVSAGWFLTGESRPYKFQEGIWDNVKPYSIVGKGGWGAWEAVVRYSNADLNDAGIFGGEQQNVTFGLNWYPAPMVRFMADYVKVLDVHKGKFDGTEPSAFVLRSMVYW